MSTAKVLAKCKLEYYRFSECTRAVEASAFEEMIAGGLAARMPGCKEGQCFALLQILAEVKLC